MDDHLALTSFVSSTGNRELMQKPVSRCLSFTKCHTDGNSFIIAESTAHCSTDGYRSEDLARRICDSRLGIGADGLILFSRQVSQTQDTEFEVRLWNSDGGKAEISGNGTCCLAALLIWKRFVEKRFIACTAAGRRKVQFLDHEQNLFRFTVDMGVPVLQNESAVLRIPSSKAPINAVLLNVGNPQCAIIQDNDIPAEWRRFSNEIATNGQFPMGVNISFSRIIDKHTLSTVFFERGAGETFSSGTGSIAAAVAAVLKRLVESPVTVLTAKGSLMITWPGPSQPVQLEGHAEVVSSGYYYGCN